MCGRSNFQRTGRDDGCISETKFECICEIYAIIIKCVWHNFQKSKKKLPLNLNEVVDVFVIFLFDPRCISWQWKFYYCFWCNQHYEDFAVVYEVIKEDEIAGVI